MTEGRQFTVRPLSKQSRPDLKDAFRIFLSSSSLAAIKLRAGDLCSLVPADGPPKTAIAWNAVENIQNTVVQTSRALQDCYAIKLGEKISINRVNETLENIETIDLTERSDPERISKYGQLPLDDRSHWEWALEHPLARCEILTIGLSFEMELKGQRRVFQVESIRGQSGNTAHTLYRFTEETRVVISDDSGIEKEKREQGDSFNLRVQLSGVGGMSRPVKIINESLADFRPHAPRLKMPSFYHPTQGVLIYGPKGTGKTTLLQQIEAAGWRKTINVGIIGGNPSEGEAKLRGAFSEALHNQPSVILFDQLETIAPKKATLDSLSLAPALCEGLGTLKEASVLVVAATRHPNDVDDSLRTPHRLAIEVELQVPTAQDRAEIIRAICGANPGQIDDTLVQMIAEKTHGYVGADLFALLQTACRKARKRQTAELDSMDVLESTGAGEQHAVLSEKDTVEESAVALEVKEDDVLSALQEIRPTAMREVFLETPKVRWSDIGGQHEVKKRLQKAVERPLKVW